MNCRIKPKAITPKPKVGYLGTKPKPKMSKERIFCVQQYNYDNECIIIEKDGINCLVEYFHWRNVNGTNLRSWVTKNNIRNK